MSLTGHINSWLTELPFYDHGKETETSGITINCILTAVYCA